MAAMEMTASGNFPGGSLSVCRMDGWVLVGRRAGLAWEVVEGGTRARKNK
jgi:hypothetical protein